MVGLLLCKWPPLTFLITQLKKSKMLCLHNTTDKIINQQCPDMKPIVRLLKCEELTGHCVDRVSSCNIYAVQQDTQSVSMSEFIQHLW